MFYAKPLVWTPPGAVSEQVIAVSNQNIIRILDGLTGTLINSRTLDPPFQSADTLGCGDIPHTVGITGTPIIDGVRCFSVAPFRTLHMLLLLGRVFKVDFEGIMF